MIIVHEQRCPQNHKCPLVALCPADAIQQVGFNAPMVVKERCRDCGICAESCPMEAVEVTA